MSSAAPYCTATVIQEAEGHIEAQKAISGVQDESHSVDHCWLAFVQLAARYSWKSAACRAFVLELAKRAAAG